MPKDYDNPKNWKAVKRPDETLEQFIDRRADEFQFELMRLADKAMLSVSPKHGVNRLRQRWNPLNDPRILLW